MTPFPFVPICVVFAAAAQSQQDTQIQQAGENAILTTARSLRLQNQHAAAATMYAKFVAKYPKSSRLFEARFWLAKSLFANQKWEEAASAFTEFLKHHPDQRVFSKQAKEDRIQCWKLRQEQNPKAASSLKDALNDQDEDIRIFAALALAENKDASGRQALEQGLNNDVFSERCGLALWKLGIIKQPSPSESHASRPRIFVVRVKTDDDNFEMRIPINFVAGIEKSLPAETREELAKNGANIPELANLAKTAKKGQVLFEFKDNKAKTSIVILVD